MKKKREPKADKQGTSVEQSEPVLEQTAEDDTPVTEAVKQSPEPEAATKNTSPAEPTGSKPVSSAERGGRNIIAIIALILVVVLAGTGYYFYLQINTKLNATTVQLSAFDDNQRQQRQQSQENVMSQLENATKTIEQLSNKVSNSEQNVALLQQKLMDVSGRRPNDWLLAEANYMVNLAGRKLWQEQDHQTASALLATADLRVAEMNDPALISLRKSLAQDIATLKALPKDQTEFLALKIDGLISQVDNLKLNMVKLPEAVEAEDDGTLSASPADWKTNIAKTWHGFVDGFITVRRRNSSIEPLMSPKQQWYLEENLKSKLLQAQLALYRHQQDAFEQAVELSNRWLMQFYDRKDSTTEFMLEQLSQLKQQDIAVEYPERFASGDMIYLELKRRGITASNGQGR